MNGIDRERIWTRSPSLIDCLIRSSPHPSVAVRSDSAIESIGSLTNFVKFLLDGLATAVSFVDRIAGDSKLIASPDPSTNGGRR
jgi:hypothetical protein